MKVLIFDTETTNILPKGIPLMKAYVNHYPTIVQISFILYDTIRNTLCESHDYVVKISDDVELSEESTNIHGITRDIMNSDGIDIKHALGIFKKCYDKCDRIVAHNIKFDKTMLIVECMRLKIPSIIQTSDHGKLYCTMNKTMRVCNITIQRNGGSYMKFPTQLELHSHLFENSINPDKLHNSFNDILVCTRCYMKFEHDEDVFETSADFSNHFAKLLK